jgi:large subunit ribosomal protein L31
LCVDEVDYTLFVKLILVSKRGRDDSGYLPITLNHLEKTFVKKDIHPQLNSVCFQDVSTGKKFYTRSTMTSGKTENLKGVDYSLVVRDVTMDSHPAFTGEKRFVDTAGRVEKFQSKFSRRRAE